MGGGARGKSLPEGEGARGLGGPFNMGGERPYILLSHSRLRPFFARDFLTSITRPTNMNWDGNGSMLVTLASGRNDRHKLRLDPIYKLQALA